MPGLAILAELGVPDADLGDVPPGARRHCGRSLHGRRYSPLAQVTTTNAGRLEAAWTYRTGGVAFLAATIDDYLRAYDVTTGKQLWQHRPPAGGQATPAAYMAGDRQFIVQVAGGHGSIGTRAGDPVIAFALLRS